MRVARQGDRRGFERCAQKASVEDVMCSLVRGLEVLTIGRCAGCCSQTVISPRSHSLHPVSMTYRSVYNCLPQELYLPPPHEARLNTLVKWTILGGFRLYKWHSHTWIKNA